MLAPTIAALRKDSFSSSVHCAVVEYSSVHLLRNGCLSQLLQAKTDLAVCRQYPQKLFHSIASCLADLETGFLWSCEQAGTRCTKWQLAKRHNGEIDI